MSAPVSSFSSVAVFPSYLATALIPSGVSGTVLVAFNNLLGMINSEGGIWYANPISGTTLSILAGSTLDLDGSIEIPGNDLLNPSMLGLTFQDASDASKSSTVYLAANLDSETGEYSYWTSDSLTADYVAATVSNDDAASGNATGLLVSVTTSETDGIPILGEIEIDPRS